MATATGSTSTCRGSDVPIIDLSASTTAPDPSGNAVTDAPRRVGLNLIELQEAARLAGDAPLPFTVASPPASGAMESRLGSTPTASDDAAYRAVLAALPSAADSLDRRGLVADGRLEPGMAGALGLLATPSVAIDLDVALPGSRLRAWHRQSAGAVATLATCDGIVFELSWYRADVWPTELARAVTPPADVALAESAVPAYLDLPLDLAEAAADAVAGGRTDLVDVLLDRGAAVRGEDGDLSPAEAHRALHALATETRGRVRALVARTPAGAAPRTIGVVSWTLVADGWRHLRPYRTPDGPRVGIIPAEPADLAGLLAPTLAAAR